MVDLKAIIADVRDTLAAELSNYLSTLYLFGPAAREEYVHGSSDIDLLLIVSPEMPLVAARHAFRPGEWNSLEIKAEDNQFTIWLNGVQTVDTTDEMSDKGFFGLQLHSIRNAEQVGKKILWKNIKVKIL